MNYKRESGKNGAQKKTPLLGQNHRFKHKNGVLRIEDEGARTLNLRIDSPKEQEANHCNNKDLTDTENISYKHAYKEHSESTSQQDNPYPMELQEIIHQWGQLPEHVRQTIKMLVETAGKNSGSLNDLG